MQPADTYTGPTTMKTSNQIFTNQLRKIKRRHITYASVIMTLLFISSISLLSLSPYRAHEDSNQYFRAKVTSERIDKNIETGSKQVANAKLLDGPQKGHSVDIDRFNNFGDASAKRLPIGSEVLLTKNSKISDQYSLISRWYMPGIATLFIVLLVLVVVIGAWRGITSIFGLALSVTILATFVVPRIISGHNAFVTCIEGAVSITLVSVYVAHGFTKRTTIACMSSLITLMAIIGLTAFASYVTGTSEVIDETNVGLMYAKHPIDLGGLLTGGVVIASLGTLFDITTGQAAIIDEIHKANRKLPLTHLFWKGMSVGREHIAALINTLALVYVGVALPSIVTTIILSQEGNYHAPLLVSLNTEIIAEEVMRTCIASIGILLALPITTWLAAYILPRWTPALDKKIKKWLKNL